MFTLLKDKLPIIFIGDLKKINEIDSNFLSKIIDQKIELPYVLHEKNIWESYLNTIEHHFSIELSDDFKHLIKEDDKNLRDRFHFNEYLNFAFFENNKVDHVQVEQQLLVIYTYLFYPNLYSKLLSNKKIEFKKIEKEKIEEMFFDFMTIEEQLFNLQNINLETYPPCFSLNKEIYFPFEISTNKTEEEIKKDFTDESKLLQKIIEGDNNSDLFRYLSYKFNTLDDITKSKFLKISLDLCDNNVINQISQLVIRETYNKIRSENNITKPFDTDKYKN